jgi:hypothetical protein
MHISFNAPRYPYFDVVVELAWSNDPESYVRDSLATGRVSHAGQVKGDDPGKKGYHGPPGWGLGKGLTTSPRKTLHVSKPEETGGQGPLSGCCTEEDEKEDVSFNHFSLINIS